MHFSTLNRLNKGPASTTPKTLSGAVRRPATLCLLNAFTQRRDTALDQGLATVPTHADRAPAACPVVMLVIHVAQGALNRCMLVIRLQQAAVTSVALQLCETEWTAEGEAGALEVVSATSAVHVCYALCQAGGGWRACRSWSRAGP